MTLKVAFQMVPIEQIDIRGDSTFALLLEAQRRGHEFFYYTPNNLALKGWRLVGLGPVLEVEDKPGAHCRLSNPSSAYITTTILLERIHPETLVVNDPESVLNAPEKVFVLDAKAMDLTDTGRRGDINPR